MESAGALEPRNRPAGTAIANAARHSKEMEINGFRVILTYPRFEDSRFFRTEEATPQEFWNFSLRCRSRFETAKQEGLAQGLNGHYGTRFASLTCWFGARGEQNGCAIVIALSDGQDDAEAILWRNERQTRHKSPKRATGRTRPPGPTIGLSPQGLRAPDEKTVQTPARRSRPCKRSLAPGDFSKSA